MRFSGLAVLLAWLGGCGDDGGEDPLAVVTAKAGTYEGSWELFGLDADCRPESAMSWTDVATAAEPTLEADRAFVHVADHMTLASGMEIDRAWLEGVFVEDDGTAGAQFIDEDGVVTVLEEVEPYHFRYSAPLADVDRIFLACIPPETPLDGGHVVDKIVTFPGDQETHSIHRATHLAWTDPGGKARTADFESLAGTHRKVAPPP